MTDALHQYVIGNSSDMRACLGRIDDVHWAADRGGDNFSLYAVVIKDLHNVFDQNHAV